MTIALEPASVLRGRVVDADGHGVEWAAVTVRVPGRDDKISTFTGSEGRFSVSIPEGTSVDLDAHPPLATGTSRSRRFDIDPAHAGHLSSVTAGGEDVVVKLPR
jgi:hypothetical protein